MSFMIALSQAALWLWFLGCVTTYRFRGRLLVEGMGIRSAEFVMLCLYSAGLAARWCFPGAGRWILAGILLAWLTVQFLCHWRFTLFGASERKVKGYNESFRDTIRLLPESDRRVIPDYYHIVLHLLILLNLVLAAVG